MEWRLVRQALHPRRVATDPVPRKINFSKMLDIILFDDIFNTGIQKLSSLINPNPLVGCQAIGFDAVTLRYRVVVACYATIGTLPVERFSICLKT